MLEEAWRQAAEQLNDGKIVLPAGAVINPGEKGAGDHLRFVMGLLHFKPPRKKETPLPEDFLPQMTTKASA